jgi:hypothetical protein
MLTLRVGLATIAWFGSIYIGLSLLLRPPTPLLVESIVHKANVAGAPAVMLCSPYGLKLPGPKFPVEEEHGA